MSYQKLCAESIYINITILVLATSLYVPKMRPKTYNCLIVYSFYLTFISLLFESAFCVCGAIWKTDAKRARQQERECEENRENQVFWQLGLALVVIRREGSERERGI